ncbi:MAG: hypothetical protein JWL79_230 [Frankiales bacterium]|nr:hypothetical protein [Frankiales bacterium]
MSGVRTACPSCAARVRPEATFCGQCYADFRPAPPVAPLVPAPTAAYGPAAADPLTAPLLDVVLPPRAVPTQPGPAPAAPASKTTGWPCSRCEHLNDFADVLCTTCSSPFLAKVAEETAVSIRLPLVGDLSRLGRGQRAGIAFAAILIVLVPLALITLLLTHAPAGGSTPDSTTTNSSTPSPAG